MDFTINREAALRPLQLAANAVDKKQALPILANLLLNVEENQLQITGTDLEVELVASVGCESVTQAGALTVPARKLLDIVRNLPDGVEIHFKAEADRLIIRCGRSRFTLASLPATDYPNIEQWSSQSEVTLAQGTLKALIDKTAFSMANQDVRYYLNGLLLELDGDQIRTVATDGHRLATASAAHPLEGEGRQCILPRKGVMELVKLLDNEEAPVTLSLGDAHLRATLPGFTFTTKLVDGRFPDYRRVIPRGGDKIILADRESMRNALARASILSNEKFRGIRLLLRSNEIEIIANNPEQEEAKEEFDVEYLGDSLEMGFNVSYLLDVLNALDSDQVKLTLADSNSSALVESPLDATAAYVVMPMRL